MVCRNRVKAEEVRQAIIVEMRVVRAVLGERYSDHAAQLHILQGHIVPVTDMHLYLTWSVLGDCSLKTDVVNVWRDFVTHSIG